MGRHRGAVAFRRFTRGDGAVRVLVTGSSGFVGGHVRQALASRGHEVLTDAALHRAGLDLSDGPVADALIAESRPAAVIHLAARVEARGDVWDDVIRSNQLSTLRLLEAVRRHAPSSHVIVASSSAAYGPVPRERNPVRESEPLRPVTMYGASKAAVEAIASAFAASRLRITVARPFNTVGPGGDRRSALAQWTRQLLSLEAGAGTPFRCGPLNTFRDLTDVRDVARAYVGLVEGDHSEAVFNVCSGRAVEGAHVLELLFSSAGIHPVIQSSPAGPGDIAYQRGDHSRLTAATGWTPAIPLEQTVDDVLRERRQSVSHESLPQHQ